MSQGFAAKPEQLVYVIEEEGDDPRRRVKIGIAYDPDRRLRTLQTGSSRPLRLLATAPGGQNVESRLHSRFASQRLEGEWFDLTTEQLDVLLQDFGADLPERIAAQEEERQSEEAEGCGVAIATVGALAFLGSTVAVVLSGSANNFGEGLVLVLLYTLIFGALGGLCLFLLFVFWGTIRGSMPKD